MDVDEIEARLAALQRESEARRRELRDIAAALPQATSRRVLVTQMTRELLVAPDRVSVAKRAVLKVARTPSDVYHRMRAQRTR
jgi:ABC-type Fe3+/spermidine/putrescine transport system ATPase subunit